MCLERVTRTRLVRCDFDHIMDNPFDLLPASTFETLTMDKGDVLSRQGQTTAGVFRVLEGAVVLQRMTQVGDVLILHYAAAGTAFAEASIFS